MQCYNLHPTEPNTRPVSRRVTFRHRTLVLFGAFMFQMSTVLRGGLRAEHRLCQDPPHSSMAVTLRSLHHLGTCFTSHGQGVEKIFQTLPAVEVFQGWTKGSACGGKVIKAQEDQIRGECLRWSSLLMEQLCCCVSSDASVSCFQSLSGVLCHCITPPFSWKAQV